MGKVISLAHRLIENEFEKSLDILLKDYHGLNNKAPDYLQQVEKLKERHADSFLEFKNRILALGYGTGDNICECDECKPKVIDVLPEVSK